MTRTMDAVQTSTSVWALELLHSDIFLSSEALTGGPAPSLLYHGIDSTHPLSLDMDVPMLVRHRNMTTSVTEMRVLKQGGNPGVPRQLIVTKPHKQEAVTVSATCKPECPAVSSPGIHKLGNFTREGAGSLSHVDRAMLTLLWLVNTDSKLL